MKNIDVRMKIRTKYEGFTVIELIMSLCVIAALITGLIIYANGKTRQVNGLIVANQALADANAAKRYIQAHYTLLEELLSTINGQTNNLVATIPFSIIKNEGFIRAVYSDTNLLYQYPCLIITYGNNQIEAFIYYRENDDKKTLNQEQLYSGLEHIGGMIGIYQNGSVIGAGNAWALSMDETSRLLVKKGSINLSQDKGQDIYECFGDNIVNNSYVINLASQLTLNNHLPDDDSLHEYPDTQNQIDSIQNTNTMLNDLNMDYINQSEANKNVQSNIIFQLNPNCIMDPKQLATMQDYDEKVSGLTNPSMANNLGCRNRQLGLNVKTTNMNSIITVTGFVKGGERAQYDSYSQQNPLDKKAQPFVGDLRADSIQPILKVASGTRCNSLELGKIARQYSLTNPYDINNIYINQVQCMKHPLCPEETSGLCYMPINTVSLALKTDQSAYSSISKLCPAGTFVSAIDKDDYAIIPKPCCGNNDPIFGSSPYCCHIDSCNKGGGSCAMVQYTDLLSGYSLYQAKLYQGIISTPAHWYQGCPSLHMGCNEGWGQVSDTYVVVRSITCTNDITQIALPV